MGYQCRNRGRGKECWVRLGRYEYIRRVTVGYSEDCVSAMQITTSGRTCGLGDVLDCSYVADLDVSDLDLGIVGFSSQFSKTSLSELSVYTAPVLSRSSLLPFTAQNIDGISFAKVPVTYSTAIQRQKQLNDEFCVIKESFLIVKKEKRGSVQFLP